MVWSIGNHEWNSISTKKKISWFHNRKEIQLSILDVDAKTEEVVLWNK